MAVKRTGLGKGLDSMIPPKATQRAVKEDKNTVSKTGETILKINEVEPNKKQPRKFFNEEALQELSDSIKQHGIVQPLLNQLRQHVNVLLEVRSFVQRRVMF